MTRWTGPLAAMRHATAALAVALPMLGAQAAEPYPSKPVTIVVPIPAGGATDALARMLAEHLRTVWKQPVIVESKPGASTRLGTQFVAAAPPDGHTLLLALTNHLTNAALLTRPGYDPIESFAPITQVVDSSGVIVADPKLPVRNWAEFVKYAKDRPGQVTHATNGIGSSAHFYASMVNDAAGIDLLIVPYKGEAPAIQDVLGSTLNSVMLSPATYRGLAPSGKVRGLAVSSTKRLGLFPELPTLLELGIPGPSQIGGWFGLFAPAGTPTEVVDKIATDVRKYLQDPVQRARIVNELGYEPVGSTPAEFTARLRKDLAAWKAAARTYHISLD